MSPVPRDTPRPVVDYLDRHRWPVHGWRLVERFFTGEDLGRTETLFALGNGYLGMRGNVEEGRESHTQGTFINGFHETWKINHAEEAFGFARVGQTIVNAPDVKVIRLYVDDEPLLLPVADLIDYERSLDFRTGVLCREIVWRTPAGKRVRIKSQRMVSFTQRHLAVMTFEVTMLDAAAPVTLSSQILNRQDGGDEYHVRSAAMGEGTDPRKAERFGRRVLIPELQDAGDDDARVMLGYRTAESGMTIAVATDHTIETRDPVERTVQVTDDMAKVVYQIDAQPGRTIRLTKVAAYHTSRGVPARELADRCRRTLDRVASEGVGRQFADQKSWLDDYWSRADATIGGQPSLQQALRWNLFQVAQAAARAEGAGIPAKGVTGSGYGGHYFWDTEVYVLPFLTYAYPQLARAALRFRYNMLPAARRRARDLSQRGALFPWRTINGEEASAYYAAGTAQYHIDADISHALSRYVDATGDTDFLMREGIDVLVETARMWADLGFWRSEGRGSFHIHGVTGPDEYTTVVNDNLFTNVMARHNLRRAARAARELESAWPQAYSRMVKRLNLDTDEVEEWERAGEAMVIPYDEHLGIHPQDSHFLEREVWDLPHTPANKRPLLLHYHPLVIYRFQVLKQADVVLALYLQGDQFTTEQKRRNFEYYDPITTGDSTLSAVVQALIAAEVGYSDLALRYFTEALYVDLADLHGNASDGVHVASTGGVWSALATGFGGFRDYNGEFSIDPRLPSSWDSLTYRVTIHGSRIRVDVREDQVELTVERGPGAKFSVRGSVVHVTAEEPVVVPLDGQGPLLEGGPGPGPLDGVRRADGSIITATVPHP
ncbi:glycoside hydrolase family 65 protein [Mumia sp. zg.B17]|uniref:glycoside hydrolase family 65 protein n=1 Tax=Mumia sp. zg.B17 TaxID=2855446 RepID=UPI001C6E34C0|nr:glycosyl hydrolase family 65 protein [Mumia sp. zg.B17]MBW9207578.1 glycoside hydrolase family 65 protein [Mumia sp. zg.B17]